STARERKSAEIGQWNLFSSEDESLATRPLPDVPEWKDIDRLGFERDVLGFYISGHPLSDHETVIRRFTNMDSRRLGELEASRKVRMAGLIRSSKIRTTRAGKRMATLLMEDQDGTADMVMFPSVFDQNYLLLDTEEPVFIEGNAEVSDDGTQVLIQSIALLSEWEKDNAKRMVLQIHPGEQGFNRLNAVRDVLVRHPGDCPVSLFVHFEDREVEISVGKDYVVLPTEELTSELSELVGTEAVYFE
ncbi:MAG: hypothetical protein HOL05_18240, partial [Nitrospinaceae bacterium]|nr:hypothetical protein [Nitrospinaceae bacterium]